MVIAPDVHHLAVGADSLKNFFLPAVAVVWLCESVAVTWRIVITSALQQYIV